MHEVIGGFVWTALGTVPCSKAWGVGGGGGGPVVCSMSHNNSLTADQSRASQHMKGCLVLEIFKSHTDR